MNIRPSLIIPIVLLSFYQLAAQTEKVEINLRNTDLVTVLKTIESQSSYRFSYNASDLSHLTLKRVRFKSTPLSSVLEYLENQTSVDFVVAGNLIGVKYAQPTVVRKEARPVEQPDKTPKYTISGVVRDLQTQSPLTGATVAVLNEDARAIADLDGRFTLTYFGDTANLVFNYLGYESKVLEITPAMGEVEVLLKAATTALDEVVVIGYTEHRVRDLTGSVGVVKLEGIRRQPLNSMEQALQGNASGVQVTNDGSPGGGVSVRIRGYGTIGNSDPLYVIDGVPTKTGLNQFNVNDIASIQVLKDAAATAIYGSRAANGVVIITTKKGQYKAFQKVTLDVYSGLQTPSNLPEMLNTEQYASLFWQAQQNAGIIPSNEVFGDGSSPVIPEFLDDAQTIASSIPGTNWFDELFSPAQMHSVNLGYQTGSQNTRSVLSASFLSQEGIMNYTGFQRFTLRSNSEFKTWRDRIKLGENFNFSYSDITSFPTNAALGSRIIHAYRMNPIVPVKDINGGWASSVKGVQGAENPLALNYFDKDDQQVDTRVFGNLYMSIEPLRDLVFKTDFGLDYGIRNSKNYSPRFEMGDAVRAVNGFSQFNSNSLNWVWNNTARYSRQFRNHRVSLLAGTEAIKFVYDEFGASRDNFFTDDLNYVYLSSGEGEQTNSGRGTQWALFSVFSRLDYSFRDKYLIGASLRRDGSSRFSPNNRFAMFPAFSLGWRLSEEPFLSDVRLIDDLKLRFSWGESGNQEIGDFASFSSFSTNSNDTNYDLNGTNNSVETGFKASRIGNPNIVWETTEQFNWGLDLSLFDYHLNFTADFFIKNTRDILLQRPTLAVEGQAESPFVNAGEMRNTGLELQVKYLSRPIGKFSYEIGANATFIDNEVIKLADDVEFINGFVSNSSTRNLTISRTQVGLPIAQMYGHVVEGIFRSQAEVDSHADQPGKGIGRIKFKDLNNDGVIDALDRTVIGNPHPDVIFGLNLNARYGKFDLAVFLQGVYGADIYNFTRYYTDFFFDLGNRHVRILDAWTASNPNAKIPRIASVDVNNELRPSTYFVEDGSFLRLKNVQLGYNFQLTNQAESSLRIYLQAHNLLTFTRYSGMDPEVSLVSYTNRNRNLDLGVDRGIYPNSRVFTLGANLQF